jgi:hypothetical protein
MARDSTVLSNVRQCPPLPDTDSLQADGSNFLANISLEPASMDYVEGLARLQAEAAGDDFFLDLGGATEARQNLLAAEPLVRLAVRS